MSLQDAVIQYINADAYMPHVGTSRIGCVAGMIFDACLPSGVFNRDIAEGIVAAFNGGVERHAESDSWYDMTVVRLNNEIAASEQAANGL